jgi:hypothetical protein
VGVGGAARGLGRGRRAARVGAGGGSGPAADLPGGRPAGTSRAEQGRKEAGWRRKKARNQVSAGESKSKNFTNLFTHDFFRKGIYFNIPTSGMKLCI